jgi:hypothetical protein
MWYLWRESKLKNAWRSTSPSLELVGNLSLETLLERIVILARTQVDAKYAALGVLDDHGKLTQFIPIGIESGRYFKNGAPAARSRADWCDPVRAPHDPGKIAQRRPPKRGFSRQSVHTLFPGRAYLAG